MLPSFSFDITVLAKSNVQPSHLPLPPRLPPSVGLLDKIIKNSILNIEKEYVKVSEATPPHEKEWTFAKAPVRERYNPETKTFEPIETTTPEAPEDDWELID